jgi:hypothetical protein
MADWRLGGAEFSGRGPEVCSKLKAPPAPPDPIAGELWSQAGFSAVAGSLLKIKSAKHSWRLKYFMAKGDWLARSLENEADMSTFQYSLVGLSILKRPGANHSS